MTRVWRVSTFGRAGSFVLPIGCGVFGGTAAGGFTGVIFPFLVGLMLWWLSTIRPALTLTGEEVIVRNPVRTTRVPLADIAEVRPGRRGVTIRTTDDRKVSAWAVQRSNLARWTGRDTRADQVTEAIRAAVRGC
ncbi:MAG: PH domain-containing protein [Actinoplanes sp.]